jgi:hypothetical protein
VTPFHTACRTYSTNPADKAASSFDRQNVINQVQQLRELAFARKFDIYQEDIDEETSEIALRTSFLALSRSAV